MSWKLIGGATLAVLMVQAAPRPAGPAFAKVYPLKAEEGVFAYARISPDGRTLAYASEMPDPRGGIQTTQTVVDLPTRKVLFTEPGIDAYFSTDSSRFIFLAQGRRTSVTIRHQDSGALTRDAAPVGLGDYFSWAKHDGRDLILTIQSQYYYLDGDKAVLPAGRVPACDGIGVGERPLISRDGQRISTFVRGSVVIRNRTDCNFTLDTGLQGAKADFSANGRHVAFHVPRAGTRAYDVVVVDIQGRTMRTLTTNLSGSSLFPSWTDDGRLCFRYDGDDYRGFMMAERVLEAPAKPLPARRTNAGLVPETPAWSDVFPETPTPASRVALVMIWASWNSHAPEALRWLDAAATQFQRERRDVQVFTAVEPASRVEDVARVRPPVTVRQIPLQPDNFLLTEAVNQIPATLLFRDGRLVGRRLGAQSPDELAKWVGQGSNWDAEAVRIPYR